MQDVSEADCMTMLKAVDVKTYNRTDVPGHRIGFIAQDIDGLCPPEWGNLVQMQFGGDSPLLSLAYDRLVCVLWAVCKNQEARIAALEGGGTRKAKHKAGNASSVQAAAP